jgi:hypothetical protein
MTIKSGYQLLISTWENDLDAEKTQVFDGLTVADVSFYLYIARHFYSCNDARHKDGLGNAYNDTDVYAGILGRALSKYPEISNDIRAKCIGLPDELEEDREDMLREFFYDVLGYPEAYNDGFFARVFESCKVYYFIDDVADLSKEF